MGDQRSTVRVLHVVSSTDRRGAEVAAVALAEALEAVGCPGSVIALEPGRSGGLDLPVAGPTRFSVAGMARLRRETLRSDVVIAHGSNTLLGVAVATRGTRVPFIYRSIGDPAAWATTAARRLRIGAATRMAASVVALWRAAAVTWHERLRVPAHRITVIPNGSDPGRFRPSTPEARMRARQELGLPTEGPLAVYLGALSREKRLDLVVEAVLDLPGVNLSVVGAGPEEAAVRAAASGSGDGRIWLLGQTDRPDLVLSAADVLVLASDTEGMPAAAIEAGLSGVPVAGTLVGGMSEIVLSGQTGVLVPPGDGRALASAVRSCLEHQADMGHAARAHCCETFDNARLVHRWRDLLIGVTTE